MKCPVCGNEKTTVVRTEQFESTKRRIRLCVKCLNCFKTHETVIADKGHSKEKC